MSKSKLSNKFSRTINRRVLKLKKHSPEILVMSGVIGLIGSGVMACKATTKLSSILDESKKSLDEINNYVEEHGYSEEYTELDAKKDLRIVRVQSGLKIAKLYGTSIAVAGISTAAILSGHGILRKRNMDLLAAYTAVDTGFKDYRKRVVERFGEELDKELKYNIKQEELEVINVDKNGKEHIEKTPISVGEVKAYSDYARFFDESCTAWVKDPEYNLMFLKNQQRYAQDMLESRGHLFLNEVYDLLGMDRTRAGACVGWIYDEENPNGDNVVDFGIYDLYDARKRAFVNGFERSILLDFNVDGPIIDLI